MKDAFWYQAEDLDDLEKSIKRLGEYPKKQLTSAVRAGAKVVHRAIVSNAPELTGDLKRGIIIHKERTKTPGKVVYDLMFDPAKNKIFQKPIKNKVRSKVGYAYYPASQEYGFFTRRPGGGMEFSRPDGDGVTLDKVPGKHFMREGAESASEQAKSVIIGKALADIEKEWD